MEAPGAPSPATLSRPMPAKSRWKSAALTPRRRGDPAPVACSPGAHSSRQLSRCPRKPTKRCRCVHSSLLSGNIGDVDQWIRLLYCSLYSRPTRHTKREIRDQAPHPQRPSLGGCRPSRDGNRQPQPLEGEETRPPSHVHQAHTVPGSYHGARGSKTNVADVFTVSCCAQI